MKTDIFSKIKKFLSSKKLRKGVLLGGISSFLFVLKVKAIEPITLGIIGGSIALAGIFGIDLLKGAVDAAIWFIALVVKAISANIIVFEVKLLSWVTSIDTFSSLPIVQHGWRITRDISYIFFIIILIVIAIATILGLKEYGAKNTLWKVIVMAVLINFSLLIGGTIIDFGQVLFNFFLMAPLEEKTNFQLSYILANQLKLNKLFQPAISENITGKQDKTQEKVDVLSSELVTIVFSFAMVIVLGVLIGVLLKTSFFLWILLIVSPLAWMLWAVPYAPLAKYSADWWKQFFNNVSKRVIVAFFIFLAISMSLNLEGGGTPTGNTMNDSNIRVVADGQGIATTDSEVEPGSTFDKLFGSKFFQNPAVTKQLDHETHYFTSDKKGIFNIISILVSLLTAALLFAPLFVDSSGISGKVVGGLKNLGTKAFAKGKDWGKKGITGAGKGALNWGAPRLGRLGTGISEWTERKLPGLHRFGRGVATVAYNAPMIGTAARGLRKGIGGYERKIQKETIDKQVQYMEGLSSNQISSMWKGGRLKKENERIAAGKVLAERGDINQQQFNELRSLYQKNRMEKDRFGLEKMNPHLTSSFKNLALDVAQAQGSPMNQNFDLATKQGIDNLKQRTRGVKDKEDIEEIIGEIIGLNFGGNREEAKRNGWNKDRIEKITGAKDIDMETNANVKLNIDKTLDNIKKGTLPTRIREEMKKMFEKIDFEKISVDFEKDPIFQQGAAGYNFMATMASNLKGENLVKLLSNFKDSKKAKSFLLTSIRNARGKTEQEKLAYVNQNWNTGLVTLDGNMGANLGDYTMTDLTEGIMGDRAKGVEPFVMRPVSPEVDAERYEKFEDPIAESGREYTEGMKEELGEMKEAMRKKSEVAKEKYRETVGKIKEKVKRRVEDIEEKAQRRYEEIERKEEEKLVKKEQEVEARAEKKMREAEEKVKRQEKRAREIREQEEREQEKRRKQYE